MPECSAKNSADKGLTLLVWDADGEPPVGDWTTTLWRHYASVKDPTAVSMPEFVELHAGDLRARYLGWIHDLGELKIGGRRVIDHLAIRPGFSYWWMSSLAQKFNVSGDSCINDAIKTIALEMLVVPQKVTSIVLISGNYRLNACVQLFCRRKGLSYEWRKIKDSAIKWSLHALYRSLPRLWQALIYLAWYVLNVIPLFLRKQLALPAFVGELVFIDVLVHLDKRALSNRRIISNYWTALVGKLSEWQIKSSWLHAFFRHPAIPSPVKAQLQIDRFNANSNGSQLHVLIEHFLNFRMLVTVICDYLKMSRSLVRLSGIASLRPAGSDVNLWPLHAEEWADSLRGKEAMVNCLRLSLIERAITHLPPQRLGIYISENQPWEMALVYAWKAAGHGTLIGTPHTTVRFWDLRYHYDARGYLNENDKGVPLPDVLAVNGPVAREIVLGSGYPPERVTQVEALRFLHLLRPRPGDETKRVPRNELRVLVCGDFLAATNRRILTWLEIAARSLPHDAVYVFKPHPACPLNSNDYPVLQLEMSEAPLADLFAECDVVFASNITSAAVDAYCSGIPVVQMLDGTTFNMSPLRGLKGVTYVTNPLGLADALCGANQSEPTAVAPFFYLDANLPRWQRLLDIGLVGRGQAIMLVNGLAMRAPLIKSPS